jgi:hypothetical protein
MTSTQIKLMLGFAILGMATFSPQGFIAFVGGGLVITTVVEAIKNAVNKPNW